MSNVKHTQGPWKTFPADGHKTFIANYDALGLRSRIATVGLGNEDDAARIVACVNAMEGAVNPEAFLLLICGYMDASLQALQHGETKEAERYLSEGIEALSKLGVK